LHRPGLPNLKFSHPLALSFVPFPFPPETYDATAAHALSQKTTDKASKVAKAYTLEKRLARDHIGTITRYTRIGMDNQHCAKL
jgi:hypothetical protein